MHALFYPVFFKDMDIVGLTNSYHRLQTWTKGDTSYRISSQFLLCTRSVFLMNQMTKLWYKKFNYFATLCSKRAIQPKWKPMGQSRRKEKRKCTTVTYAISTLYNLTCNCFFRNSKTFFSPIILLSKTIFKTSFFYIQYKKSSKLKGSRMAEHLECDMVRFSFSYEV